MSPLLEHAGQAGTTPVAPAASASTPVQDVAASSASGFEAPVTPQVMDAVSDLKRSDVEGESDRAQKTARLNALQEVYGGDPQEMHEDETVQFSFADDELDNLEDYDHQLSEWDDEGFSFDNSDEQSHRLMLPYTRDEPNLSPDELHELDVIADYVEVNRLKGLGVLLDVSTLDGKDFKKLSTRFVRTWRDKTINGKHVWLRRSRFVAREFAWLDPSRESLFSLASSSISHRILPCIFLRNLENDWTMGAVDIADAFLTVDQPTPTVVYGVDNAGRTVPYPKCFG